MTARSFASLPLALATLLVSSACDPDAADTEFRDLELDAAAEPASALLELDAPELDDDPVPALLVPEDPLDVGRCPEPTEFTTCTIDLVDGSTSCDNGDPISLEAFNQNGPVYALDMAEWDVAIVDVDSLDPEGWWLHLGNSPSNNGWNGDGSDNSNDSEAQLLNNSLAVYPNDFGGGTAVLSESAPVELPSDSATMVVCDGYFKWTSSTLDVSAASNFIFQIDGDEPDPQAGGINDQLLWLGVGQTVGSPGRDGAGVTSVTVTFGR